MSIERRAYRFRMEPTKEQESALLRQAGARRFVYNWALDRRRAYYQEHGKGISARQLSNELTALKKQPETSWLQGVDSQALQQALRDLDRAFEAFYAGRARYPRFRSRKRDTPTFRIPQRVRLADGRVYVPKIGWVRVRQSREVDGAIKSAAFRCTATGKWYVTLNVEFLMPDAPLPKVEPCKVVGVAALPGGSIALSDGTTVSPPAHLRRTQRRLARSHRALARKAEGSRNWRKAWQKVARLNVRVTNQRRDFLHKLTTRLVNDADAVCVEDRTFDSLARTKRGEGRHDAALGTLREQLAYKARWHLKHLVIVDAGDALGETCSRCGYVDRGSMPSDRTRECPSCGLELDRHVNSARNVLYYGLQHLVAAGHAETENACGGEVSPPETGRRAPKKQESQDT